MFILSASQEDLFQVPRKSTKLIGLITPIFVGMTYRLNNENLLIVRVINLFEYNYRGYLEISFMFPFLFLAHGDQNLFFK